MNPITLPFPGRPAPAPAPECGPELAACALPLFARLVAQLEAAADFAAECRRRTGRWQVPRLVSLARPDTAPAADWPAAVVAAARAKYPALGAAHDRLGDTLADARALLSRVEVRHAARAYPGLAGAVAASLPHRRDVKSLSRLLNLVDSEVVSVEVHDGTMTLTVRLCVDGGRDFAQLGDELAAHLAAGPAAPPWLVASGRRADRVARAGEFDRLAVPRFEFHAPDGSPLYAATPLSAAPRLGGERRLVARRPRAEWQECDPTTWPVAECRYELLGRAAEGASVRRAA